MNFYEAQLQAQRLAEQTGLSLREIAELDINEFARLTRGQTPAQAAIAAFETRYEAHHPTQATQHQDAPQSPPQPPAPEPQGMTLDEMNMEQYAALRAQLGLDKARHDQGIFGSGRATADAARFQAGRTAMSNAFVEQAPRIERAFVQVDRRDTRSKADRFGTQGNFWQA